MGQSGWVRRAAGRLRGGENLELLKVQAAVLTGSSRQGGAASELLPVRWTPGLGCSTGRKVRVHARPAAARRAWRPGTPRPPPAPTAGGQDPRERVVNRAGLTERRNSATARHGLSAPSGVQTGLHPPRYAALRRSPSPGFGQSVIDRADVDMAESVTILVAGASAAPVADRPAFVASALQSSATAILVDMDQGAWSDGHPWRSA